MAFEPLQPVTESLGNAARGCKSYYPLNSITAPAKFWSTNSLAYIVIPINGTAVTPVLEECLLCDPLTGLVAYPSFEAFLIAELPNLALARVGLHLAIGDVDNLRDYVVAENTANPNSFGHLAGNDCMCRIGESVRKWANPLLTTWPFLLCATFGGDEVIIAGSGMPYNQFLEEITTLAEQIAMASPRPCSFVVSTATLEAELRTADAPLFYRKYVAHVDRRLFQHKAQRTNARKMKGCVVDLGSINVGDRQ